MTAEKPRRRRAGPPAPVGVRVIRKYGNRRLYDTHESRYVTLSDLLECFTGAEEVQVIDAVSGEDLTKRVLAQAILAEEGERGVQILPMVLLRTLLRQRKELSRDQFERKVARAAAELSSGRSPGRADAAEEPAAGRELDELKRRLKALEGHLGGKKR